MRRLRNSESNGVLGRFAFFAPLTFLGFEGRDALPSTHWLGAVSQLGLLDPRQFTQLQF